MADDKREEMQKKLKLDMMDEHNKKQLFNKFVQSGGEIVDLNKDARKKAQMEADQRRKEAGQKEHIKEDMRTVSIRRQRLEEERRRRMEEEQEGVVAPKSGAEINPVNKWIERFSAKLGCTFSGVTNLSARKFKRKFVDMILERYQNSLLECQMVLASILHQNEMVQGEIKTKLSAGAGNPFSYELIHRFDSIYEEGTFKHLTILHQDRAMVDEEKHTFIEMFKPLYLLKGYTSALKEGAERAILLEKELRRLDANTAFSNYRKVSNQIDYIFQKVYPKFFSLIDYYYKNDTRKKYMPFKDYVGITEADQIGFLTDKWREEQEFLAQKDRLKDEFKSQAGTEGQAGEEGEAPNTEKRSSGNPTLDKAMALLKQYVDFNEILMRYRSQKDLRALFNIKDKVFLTYSMIDFFDREFSSIITTNKVNYNTIFNYGDRLDVKKEMTNNYYKIQNMVYERVNEYLKVIREIKKVENDTYISIDERSTRLNQYSVQRSQISRSMRKSARILFEKFSSALLVVVNDYESRKQILQNPDEILEYSKKYDGHRVLDGKPIHEAVKEAYLFCYLIHFLLVEGDLGGYSVVLEKPIYLNLNLQSS